MPNNIIQHLNSQETLEEKQEQILNDGIAHLYISLANFEVIYLPKLLHDFPWELIDIKTNYINATNQDDVKKYIDWTHDLHKTLQKLVDLKSPYCLRYGNNFIPLTKECIYDAVTDLFDANLTRDEFNQVNYMMNYQDTSSLNFVNFDAYDNGLNQTESENMVALYQLLRDQTWPGNPKLLQWLRSSMAYGSMYYFDYAPNMAQTSSDTFDMSKPKISNLLVEKYNIYHSNDITTYNHVMVQNEIREKLLSDDDYQYAQNRNLLSIYRLKGDFVINTIDFSDYDITDLHFVPQNKWQIHTSRIDTIIQINNQRNVQYLDKPDIYLYKQDDRLLFKIDA